MSGLTHTYKVGDHVLVRDWNDMLSEYGCDPYGDIAVHPKKLSFILGMKPFCGMELVVTKVDFDETLRQPTYFLNYLFYPVSPDAMDSPYGWTFTSAMLSPAKDSNILSSAAPASSITFDDLLQGATP